MAINRKRSEGRKLSVVCTHPTTPVSGGPVRIGPLAGVALTDERADGTTTVDFAGVYALSVKAVGDGGNSAVAVGDNIYYVDADTPVLSKKATAQALLGTALEAISSGATATILVRVAGTPIV